MNKIIPDLKQCAPFLLGCGVFLAAGVLFLLAADKTTCFIFFNQYHIMWLDAFMKYYTNLGDGLFAIVLALCCYFIWKKKKLAVGILASFLLSGILVQLAKHIKDSPRPRKFYGADMEMYFIKGIDFAHNNSFPSGHTATAFAAATIWVLWMKRKTHQVMALAFAVLVGFSRIYTGQHFLLDVVVGGGVGVVSGIAVFAFQQSRQHKLNKAFG